MQANGLTLRSTRPLAEFSAIRRSVIVPLKDAVHRLGAGRRYSGGLSNPSLNTSSVNAVMAFDAAEGGPVPAVLVAVTVKV